MRHLSRRGRGPANSETPGARLVAGCGTRWVAAASRKTGLDAEELLRAAGLQPSDGLDPEGLVPLDRLIELRRSVELRSRDPAFALHAGESLPIGELGLVDYVCLSSPTLAEAMSNLARYFPLVAQTAIQLGFHPGATQGCIEARLRVPADSQTRWLERQSAEFTFAVIVNRCCKATGRLVVPERVTFRHRRPAYAQEHRRIFEAPIEYSSPSNSMWLAERTLSLEPTSRDARLYDLLRGYAEAALARVPMKTSMADRVLRALAEEIQPATKTLESVARKLHVSARTLHRQLAEEATSFSRLKDAHLLERAEGHLRDRSMTLGEISYLLGFSEPSAFHRAFKRWLGVSPQRYRERLCLQGNSS